MKQTPNRRLVGADFSRPANDEALLFVYLVGATSEHVRIRVDVPDGWTVSERSALPPLSCGVEIRTLRLRATGSRYAIGSTVRVSLDDEGQEVEHLAIDLVSDCLTLWTLWGPCPFEEDDGLIAFSAIDRTIVAGEFVPASHPHLLQPARSHLGLQCSGYVNLAAFLENVYGPVPSGDYKVYRRLAYAQAEVYSPKARDAVLELVGEDRFCGWMNGAPVLRTAARPIVQPARGVVRLNAGRNAVVIKAVQDGTREWGGRRWGFTARLRDTKGRTLRDLVMRLESRPA